MAGALGDQPVRALVGRIQPYDWGSRTDIARVRRQPVPSPGPEAELWLGAHPAAPSTVDGGGGEDGLALDAAIAADPVQRLGPAVADKYAGRLPFLLKLLAAAKPLSLQVHPNPDQASAGFAAENAAGIPLDAPTRRYKDASHKPELLVALTETEALCGFAPLADTITLFSTLNDLGAGWPMSWLDALSAGDVDTVVAKSLAGSEAIDFDAVVSACRHLGERDAARKPAMDAIENIATNYPGDPGLFVALLLNHVILSPGEGIFLTAGAPHAYLRGFGVEIMASSDNVLRGGLTSKHVDVDELVRILRFESGPPPVVQPTTSGSTTGGELRHWPTPTEEFALSEFHGESTPDRAAFPPPGEIPGSIGPVIAICVDGEITAAAGGESIRLRSGESFWRAASDHPLTLSGAGRLFLATVGSPRTRE